MRLIIVACSVFLMPKISFGQSPDLVLVNGKIFTSDTSRLYVEALAITKGRISAAGKSEEIEKLKTKITKRVDLAGRLVVPGFNDAHNHLPDGLRARHISVDGMDPAWQTILDSIATLVKTTPVGHWIEGTIGVTIARSTEANRFSLDKIAPKHPVRLLSWWGHVGIFNTLGMHSIGISNTQGDPKGAFYERMANNKTLTGKAYEKNAYAPHTSYTTIASMRDEQALIQKLQQISQALLQVGITSYQNMCTGASPEDYIKYWNKAGLPLRLRLIRWGDVNSNGTLNIPSKTLPRVTSVLPLATVSGTKWLLEGTPLEQGSAELEPYPNRPDWYGRINYSMDEIESMCKDALARKDQIHFHINGSMTIGKVLDLMSSMNVDWKAVRPRFEHGDQIDYTPEYLKKAKALGIIVVQNPTHFAPLPGMSSAAPTRSHGMALKTLLKNKIPLAIGSDGPFNPYLNIILASTHPTRPSEAITREEAVIAYTYASAYAEFEEQNKGTLTVGKVADLAVLSDDIFSIDIPKLMQARSLLTIVNGEIAYDSGTLKVQPAPKSPAQ
ncbi:MAG: amidohydrolase family protein [Chryseolinea sp.]